VPTEDIPAVTQLFTPHWIVRYLVENSLGRLWLLNRPGSRLKEQMPYYIEGEPETDFLKVSKPEDIRVCDPACGSGHMLTYAFDLLCLIYEEEGYSPNEIPGLILRKNLHGLEICPRAAQLAEMALVFKSRAKSRRFFQPEHLVRPNIIELRNVRFAENELRDYIRALGLGDLFNQPMLRLLHQFEEAKNFGSLIQPCLDARAIAEVRHAIQLKEPGSQLFLRETHFNVLRVLEQAEALTQRCHVVVANPPYMGSGKMNGHIKAFADEQHPKSKADLFSMFAEVSLLRLQPSGFLGFVTMQGWMFLSSFSEFRKHIILKNRISSCVQIGYNSFPELNSKVALAAAFVLVKHPPDTRAGLFVNLNDAPHAADKNALFQERLAAGEIFRAVNSGFHKIPESPIAYWASPAFNAAYENGKLLEHILDARIAMATGDNDSFIRHWPEVSTARIAFKVTNEEQAGATRCRWFPCNKGGSFRKWYGNNENVVNWENMGSAIRSNSDPATGRIRSHNYNGAFAFRECLTWSAITPRFGARYSQSGFMFVTPGSSAFPRYAVSSLAILLGFLNSNVAALYLRVLSSSVNIEVGNLARIPFIEPQAVVEEVAQAAVSMTRADWDNFESSWDFRDQPLLRPGLKGATLEASWRNWEAQSTAAIRRMQELETENNRLFIATYGLQNELKPEVPEDQITLARPDPRTDIVAFISYAIGCMMGRYSLDKPGLVYANSGSIGFDPSEYRTFLADPDGIVPVTELAWFPDDAAERLVEFLIKTFGQETLAANVKFMADALNPTKDETPRDTLRRYLASGFYKDHLQTYKRRPIYWLFSSGKQRAYQCLVYLHRYNEGTLARMRTEYVIPLQGKISNRIDQLAGDIPAATSTSHRKKLEKERESLVKQASELAAFDEKLRHYADQRIALDLDDGVKVNYGKFGDLLAEVKAVTGGSED
jgi:hypothetical protein